MPDGHGCFRCRSARFLQMLWRAYLCAAPARPLPLRCDSRGRARKSCSQRKDAGAGIALSGIWVCCCSVLFNKAQGGQDPSKINTSSCFFPFPPLPFCMWRRGGYKGTSTRLFQSLGWCVGVFCLVRASRTHVARPEVK